MDFLPDSLRETISKLSDNQKEEIDFLESIFNIDDTKKEITKEKLFRFIEERKPENCIKFLLRCINHATLIRPKERKNYYFLLTSVFNDFHLNYEIIERFHILISMLQVNNVVPPNEDTSYNVFDFADEGTVGRAIFDDNVDSLRQLLAFQTDGGKRKTFYVDFLSLLHLDLMNYNVNRIEVAASFGSIKCFKFLIMNGDEINEETCKFAVAGGNSEIIHLCEQKELVFKDCLFVSSVYHRFEIFEWLNTHFNYEEMHLSEFIDNYNEPLFYFYSFSCLDNDKKDKNGITPINQASQKGLLEVVKYLYETCHADVETKDNGGRTPINKASLYGHIDVVKYLYETCYADVETKDKAGSTPINNASKNGHLEIVKYLHETCHVDVEAINNYRLTPMNNASKNGRLEVVKYLCETCHADVETRDAYSGTPLYNASSNGFLEVVKYLYETYHVDAEAESYSGLTPINIASCEGRFEVVKYLYETCHVDAETKDENGFTPIFNAYEAEHFDIVEYLEDKKTKHKVYRKKCRRWKAWRRQYL